MRTENICRNSIANQETNPGRIQTMAKKQFESRNLYLCALVLFFGALTVSSEVLGQTTGSGDQSAIVNQLMNLTQPQNRGPARRSIVPENSAVKPTQKGNVASKDPHREFVSVARKWCRGEEISDSAERSDGPLRVSHDDFLNSFDDYSRLERDYCKRIGHYIQLAGYENFQSNQPAATLSPTGKVPDDYVLGTGDEIFVSIRGRQDYELSGLIDRGGNITFAKFEPIHALGMRFGEFRRHLVNLVTKRVLGVKVFISLGNIRHITVTVLGEVVSPGIHTMSGLSTIFDVLRTAGGIKKSGSLRQIKVIRGDAIFWFDAYELLFFVTDLEPFKIRDNDRLIIPKIGTTIAVAGDVANPVILEIPEGRKGISVAEALKLSGGLLRPSGQVMRISSFTNEGVEKSEVIEDTDRLLKWGDILRVDRIVNFGKGEVEIIGHLHSTGKRTLNYAPDLYRLVKGKDYIKSDAYLEFSVLETTNIDTGSRYFYPINLRKLLAKKINFALRDGDKYYVFSKYEIAAGSGLFSSVPGLSDFALQHSVTVTGGVNQEGLYPIVGPTQLSDVISLAGNFKLTAVLTKILLHRGKVAEEAEKRRSNTGSILMPEIINAMQPAGLATLLHPRDSITVPIRPLNTISIEVSGEVFYPGTYTLYKGVRLSQLLTIAGGLTPLAYPYGAIFTRETIKVDQQKSYDNAALRLKRSILVSQTNDTSLGSEQVNLGPVLELLNTIEGTQALGRMEIEADPTVLLVREELNIGLRDGDSIFIPERPSTVYVVGEVLNPGARMFRSGMKVDDYINSSGGITEGADEDRIFIILPNGAAERVTENVWNYNPIILPPGSTVVIPLDLKPFSVLVALKDITSIFSQMAVTVAALSVLSNQ